MGTVWGRDGRKDTVRVACVAGQGVNDDSGGCEWRKSDLGYGAASPSQSLKSESTRYVMFVLLMGLLSYGVV